MLYEWTMTQWICFLAADARRKEKIGTDWEKDLRMMAKNRPSIHTVKMIKSFFGKRIQLIQRAADGADPEGVTVLCVEKDSLGYMREFLPYYRKTGIRHFVIIDNGSTDGTDRYLLEQKDVTLYSAPFPFEHHKQAGWLLQALQETGKDRWYLHADADEFFTWPGMENSTVHHLVRILKTYGMGTFRTVMIDMYPDYPLLDPCHNDENFLEDYIYFDDASNYICESYDGLIFGGMRARLIGLNLRMDKYVLFDAARGYLPVMNHDVSKTLKTEEENIYGGLRHYKFLPSERDKYMFISTSRKSGRGRFAEMKKHRHLLDNTVTAFSERSLKYENSKSLQKLELIKPLNSVQAACMRNSE